MNDKLIENNYLVIPNFISPARAKLLSNEFKLHCQQQNILGDDQAPNSHAVYNHISFLELLCEKTPEVSSLLEETVLPTYSYARVYNEGSDLEKHTDRDACEISLTMHLDGDYPWPIWIETPQQEKRFVSLNPGDAMIYLGRIAPHWREEYKGNYYSQVFLHYVRSRGECSYAYFDNKKDNKKTDIVAEKISDSNINKIIETKETPAVIIAPSQSNQSLESFIKIYDNIVSKELCEKILNEYKNSSDFSPTFVGNGVLNPYVRTCDGILMSDNQVIDKNFEIRKSIDVDLHQQLLKVVEKYSAEFPHFSPNIDTGYQLLRYNSGQFYTEHTDNFVQEQRSISCSVTLNEDFVGGEFAFFNREIIIRNAIGSVIVFPSNFMYPHEVMPVVEGTRYSIVTWYV